jgi:hypothetical protein
MESAEHAAAVEAAERMSDNDLIARVEPLFEDQLLAAAEESGEDMTEERVLLQALRRRFNQYSSALARIEAWPAPSDPAYQERTAHDIRTVASAARRRPPEKLCQTIWPVHKTEMEKPCGRPHSEHRNGIGPCEATGCDAFRLFGEWRAVGYVKPTPGYSGLTT